MCRVLWSISKWFNRMVYRIRWKNSSSINNSQFPILQTITNKNNRHKFHRPHSNNSSSSSRLLRTK